MAPRALHTPQVASAHLAVSQPFIICHYICIGKNRAWAELRLVIARMVWVFDTARGGKRLDWAKLKTLMTIQKDPIMVQIKIREGMDEIRRSFRVQLEVQFTDSSFSGLMKGPR